MLFEKKSITAFNLDIVHDNARCPSEELVYRAVAADPEGDGHDETISSSKFDSDQRSSRGDSRGTRNKKRAGSLAPARIKSSLEAPSRPELTPFLKDKKEKTRRSNSRESLPEWLQRLPIETQSSRIVQGKWDACRSVNEALLLSNPASVPLIRNAVVSKSA
jgi:hypothetical protein